MAKGCSFPYFFFFFFSWLKCKIDPLHFTFCHVSTLTLVSVNSVFKFQKCFNSGLPLTSVNAQSLGVWIHVCYVLCFCVFPFLFFSCLFPQQAVLFMYSTWTVATTFDHSSMNSTSVHCLRTHKFHFLSIFSLKMSPTALFTHLKIILLQCFQFSVFSFSKISSIQTDPKKRRKLI